ncbi:MAG: hypothetical protein ACT4TC_00575 [Myxococcaceae bacterium]
MFSLKRGAVVVVVLAASLAACGTLVDGEGVTSSGVIGRTGGSLNTPAGMELLVPAGALDTNTSLTIQPGVGLPPGAVLAVEIGPSGTQFSTPVTLRFPASLAKVRGEQLKVMTVENGKWVPLAGHDYDRETGMVSGKTSHLSPYALVQSSEICNNGGDDDGDGLVDCRDPACSGDAACPSTSCTTNAQCPSNDFCRAGQCNPTGFCSVHADCAADYFCMSSVCSAAGSCLTNAQCQSGGECWGGWCVSWSDGGYPTRPDGGSWDTDSGFPVYPDGSWPTDAGHPSGPDSGIPTFDAGAYCGSNADCGPNGYCYSGVCYYSSPLDAGTHGPFADGG